MERVSTGSEIPVENVENFASDGEHLSKTSIHDTSGASSSLSSKLEEGTASTLPNKRSRTSTRKRKYKSRRVRTDTQIDILMSKILPSLLGLKKFFGEVRQEHYAPKCDKIRFGS